MRFQQVRAQEPFADHADVGGARNHHGPQGAEARSEVSAREQSGRDTGVIVRKKRNEWAIPVPGRGMSRTKTNAEHTDEYRTFRHAGRNSFAAGRLAGGTR